MEVTRVFDILTLQEEKYNSDIALSVKRGGKWDSFSTSQYRKEVDAFSLGLLAMGFEKGDKIDLESLDKMVGGYTPKYFHPWGFEYQQFMRRKSLASRTN